MEQEVGAKELRCEAQRENLGPNSTTEVDVDENLASPQGGLQTSTNHVNHFVTCIPEA